MLRRIFEWIGRQETTVGGWLAAVACICTLRFFIECLSAGAKGSVTFLAPADTFIHFALFFVAVALGLACLLKPLTRNAPSIMNITLFGLCAIWIAPLVDLAFTGSAGAKMSYIFAGTDEILTRYLTTFASQGEGGLTLGLQVEIGFILCLITAFVFLYRRNFLAPLLAAPLAHLYIFILGCVTSFLVLATNKGPYLATLTAQKASDYFQHAVARAAFSQNLEGQAYVGPATINLIMIQLLLLLCVGLGLVWFALDRPKVLRATLRNCRPERTLFYMLFLALGLLLADVWHKTVPYNWADYLSIAVLALSWFAAWMYAVHVNDISDIEIDRISNPTRPFVTRELSREEMDQAGILWLVISLIGACSLGDYVFLLNLTYIACAYSYSATPLRLKRVPVLASLLIALASLVTIFAGFFLMSPDKTQRAFPYSLALGILLVFTAGVNIRDVKDIEGDKAQGIMTLPVLFGAHGAQVVGALFAASFLLAPLVLAWPLLFVLAVPAACAAYLIAVRKPYDEKWVFILYFSFVIGALLLWNYAGGSSLLVRLD